MRSDGVVPLQLERLLVRVTRLRKEIEVRRLAIDWAGCERRACRLVGKVSRAVAGRMPSAECGGRRWFYFLRLCMAVHLDGRTLISKGAR